MKQALYRKYRPDNFDKVLGQDNIVTILKNQIKNEKISHAYIFSGTRGTGKTSTAKIFAKAINCLNPKEGNPCNECANCRAVLEERTMDIVEMDAASNRRIDDIRQLRDQVIYPPTLLKYKVYIIDEAHMITNEGFNALLKIMEEPPKHLIFILATTEIDKLPDTILSRTQRFEFKTIANQDIRKQIEIILEEENIEIEDRAIDIIANIASGAMRDALSVLDQVISIGKDKISANDVYDLLGIFSDDIKIDFARNIFNKDIKSLLGLIDSEISRGKNPNNFIKEIIVFFKDLIYVNLGMKAYDFDGLVEGISLEQLVNSVDILLEYEELMKKSDSAELLFKIAAVRLIDYMPRKGLEAKITNLEERISYLEKNGARTSESSNKKSTLRSDEGNKNEPIELDESGNFLEDIDEETDSKEEIEKKEEPKKDDETSSEKLDFETEKEEIGHDEDIDPGKELIDILKNNYPPTNLLLDGLERYENRLDQIVFFVDESRYSMSLGMNVFFNKAKQDLKNKLGKEYDLKVMLASEDKNKDNNQELQNEKVESLQEFFNGNINIKE